MQIILIRHAQSKGNETSTVQGQTDNGLSELGKLQAIELSEHFKAGDLNAIYSSDLGRAVQTATPTAKKLELEIKTNPDLREAHFGIWEGLTYEGVKNKFPEEYSAWHSDYFIRPMWFESFDSHLNRIRRALEKILNIHKPNEKIAVFTHGGSIKTQVGFFNLLSGVELSKFSIKNCSLTLIKFNPTTNYKEGVLIDYNKEVINNYVHQEL